MDAKGHKFWSGNKLFPRSLTFDPADETAVAFVETAARLRAQTLQIPANESRGKIVDIAASLTFPAGPDGPKGPAGPDTSSASSSPREIARLESELPSASRIAGMRSVPLEFEKDDDGNRHIDFIAACANLRARKYASPRESMVATGSRRWTGIR